MGLHEHLAQASHPDETVYAVFARTDMWAKFLGHATGEARDIEAFYHSKREYGLVIEPIKVNHVPKGFAKSKADLMCKKRELQQQLIELEAKLKANFGE
jgi:hypothetical protein